MEDLLLLLMVAAAFGLGYRAIRGVDAFLGRAGLQTSVRGEALPAPAAEPLPAKALPENVLTLLTPKASVACLQAGNTLRQGLERMRAHGYTAVPVLREDGSYAGSVSEGDFLWHVLSHGAKGGMKGQEEYLVTDILRPGWNPPVRADASLDALLQSALEQNFVPDTDDRGAIIGIVTRKDILHWAVERGKKPPLK